MRNAQETTTKQLTELHRKERPMMITDVAARAALRGLTHADPVTKNLLPLARYLVEGGYVHWRNAANFVDRVNPEKFEGHNREIVVAIRCALANGDYSGLKYLLDS